MNILKNNKNDNIEKIISPIIQADNSDPFPLKIDTKIEI